MSNMQENNHDITTGRQKLIVSPKELIFKYLKYLPWVVLSVIIALTAAFIKLRYSKEIYNVSGKLLVKNPQKDMSGEKFDDIFMMQGNRNLDDDIEIIRSRAMAARVVNALGLQLQYTNKGKIRSTLIHPSDVPFNLIIEKADSTIGFAFTIVIVSDNEFRLNESPKLYYFNQSITLPLVTFRLAHNTNTRIVFASNEFTVSLQPVKNVAAGLSGAIQVAQPSDFSNVLLLSYSTENPKMGMEIVDQYMREYQLSSLEDKKQVLGNTLEFIDTQLIAVKDELEDVERNKQTYQERNRIFNPEQQATMFLGKQSETESQITQSAVQLKVIDLMIAHISGNSGKRDKVISALGINEPSLIEQIAEYNRLQVERQTLLKSTPEGNPLIRNIDAAIEKLSADMLSNLLNVRQTYVVTLNDLERKSRQSIAEINAIPRKERELLERSRQQNIMQELYSYLLQKKLETSIASASTISNIKVVEPAASSGGPVFPNRRSTYLFALFMGLLIPAGLIFLLEFLNDKVKGKNDIEQITDVPILGEIGHAQNSTTLVVTKNNRKFLAEQFRIVRSNLQYILPKVEKPVLLVTSSFSGEGKSFVSTNLGAVLAISGKRTIILEFDIRKPKIMKGLGLSERKGLTNYIIGNVELSEVIHPVPDVENLFVIPCGPVPPNPAEMLLNERVTELFAILRRQFDTVIIDTAPVGLVSDGVTLGRHADASIYIVRHNYTLKKQIQLIEEIYKQSKLPHLSIIINDIKSGSGYGGYYGYGEYGYGNGYGYGYFDTEKKKKNFLQRITAVFK